MSVLKRDVQIGVGNLQLCGGHAGGFEVGVHAVVDLFNDNDAEGVVQVDASSAFNSSTERYYCIMQRQFSRSSRPTSTTATVNQLGFSSREEKIRSSKGTTQGNPIATAAYGIGLTPSLDILIRG